MSAFAQSAARRYVASSVSSDRGKRHAADFYPTPANAVRALLRAEEQHGGFVGDVWEPACGDGAISRVLEAAGLNVISTDLHDYGFGTPGVDFLRHRPKSQVPNIITNPPFNLAEEFVRHALTVTSGKVVMLLRLTFLEGKRRRAMFEETPLARVHVFANRLKIWRGGVDGGKSGRGMIAYAFFVWDASHPVTRPPSLNWIEALSDE